MTRQERKKKDGKMTRHRMSMGSLSFSFLFLLICASLAIDVVTAHYSAAAASSKNIKSNKKLCVVHHFNAFQQVKNERKENELCQFIANQLIMIGLTLVKIKEKLLNQKEKRKTCSGFLFFPFKLQEMPRVWQLLWQFVSLLHHTSDDVCLISNRIFMQNSKRKSE